MALRADEKLQMLQAMTTHAAARYVRELLRLDPNRTDLVDKLFAAARRLHPGVDAACHEAEQREIQAR